MGTVLVATFMESNRSLKVPDSRYGKVQIAGQCHGNQSVIDVPYSYSTNLIKCQHFLVRVREFTVCSCHLSWSLTDEGFLGKPSNIVLSEI